MWVIRIANPYDPYGLMIRMGFFWKNVIFICNIASNNNIKLISTTCNTHKERRRSSNRVKQQKRDVTFQFRNMSNPKRCSSVSKPDRWRPRIATNKKEREQGMQRIPTCKCEFSNTYIKCSIEDTTCSSTREPELGGRSIIYTYIYIHTHYVVLLNLPPHFPLHSSSYY